MVSGPRSTSRRGPALEQRERVLEPGVGAGAIGPDQAGLGAEPGALALGEAARRQIDALARLRLADAPGEQPADLAVADARERAQLRPVARRVQRAHLVDPARVEHGVDART